MKKTKSKRILTIVVLAAAAVLLFGGLYWDKGTGEHIGITTQSAVDSITIKWKKQENVQYFEVYRADITDQKEYVFPGRDAYEKIATVLGDEKSYKDTEVEAGHTYGYAVSGFHRSFGHSKEICTSFIEDDVTYETVGPAKPGLLNDGEGENYENSKEALHLYLAVYNGTEPTGIEIYRKSSTDKDFVKINCAIKNGCEILDDSVTPGETYTYKARTYVEEQGDRVYSPFSDEVTIPAVNLIAGYEVEVAGSAGDTFVIRVTSDGYNGDTAFDATMPAQYCVQKDKKSGEHIFAATLTGYSKSFSADKTDWQAVPKKGVRIKAGESIYLQYKLSKWEGYADDPEETKAEPFFGGSDAEESLLSMNGDDSGGAEYFGSGTGFTVMILDFVSGEGKAYCEFD